MTTFTDRRSVKPQNPAINRKKFVDRYKGVIGDQVDKIIDKKSIKDIVGQDKHKVSIPKKTLDEPTPTYSSKGKRDIVLPGNKDWVKGDHMPNPSGGGRSGRDGSNEDNDGTDEFEFILTKEEMLEIFFKDMELPNFIKEGLKKSVKMVTKRSGFTNVGTPSNLDIKKTYEQSISRRICHKNKDTKPPLFDEIDLRYRNFEKRPEPVKHAVMFLLMDVSGSMGEHHKLLAKKFFILLHLFLTQTYETIDVIFIRHTTSAQEVTEHQFFYDRINGGTVISVAYDLALEIKEKRYAGKTCNFYMAQASDGGNYQEDNESCLDIVANKILPDFQYFAFLQVEDPRYTESQQLLNWYKQLAKQVENMGVGMCNHPSDVYPLLHKLFQKGKK